MTKKAKLNAVLTLTAIAILGCSLIYAAQLPKQFPFKRKDALDEWEEKIFRGRVLYSVKVDRTGGYLSAYSENNASGIFYKLKFDPKKEPMISWKWRVLKFPDKERVVTEGGDWLEQDDYATRFYVIFPRLAFNLTRAIEYVWDKDLPKETVITSPYFKNIKIIVIESGEENFGKWVHEERNVYEDYLMVFGSKPGRVGAIAIMTDTDNTASTAEAYYDEIRVGYKDESAE